MRRILYNHFGKTNFKAYLKNPRIFEFASEMMLRVSFIARAFCVQGLTG